MGNLKKIIIFGTSPTAQLACHYFQTDSHYDVTGFTVDKNYINNDFFCEKPVVPFENLEDYFPSKNYGLFIAVGYSYLNKIREEKFYAAKERGYTLVNYISSRATILSDLTHCENCFILEGVIIQPYAQIQSNVFIWSGSHIAHHTSVGQHTFLAPCVAIAGNSTIGKNCFIGINSTIRDNITIADCTVIGAGSLIMRSTNPGEVYIPARTEPHKQPK